MKSTFGTTQELNSNDPPKRLVILLVDDSENDVLLMRLACRRVVGLETLHVTSDGADAIAYLNGEGRYCDRQQYPLPTVVLLDLKMPRKDGFEVLHWIRQQPLKRLPVFILTASSRLEHIERAFDLGANAYLVKPSNLDDLVELAKCLQAWVNLNHFAPLP